MQHYTQLTSEQRYQIYALLKKIHTQPEIPEVVGVHNSTICRELERNMDSKGYRPKRAHNQALRQKEERI